MEVSQGYNSLSTRISRMEISAVTKELERVYFEHYNSLVKMARLLVDDLSSASDVVQEAFVKAINTQPNLRNQDAVFYMKRAVMNVAKSHLRKRQTSRKHLSVVEIQENDHVENSHEDELPIDAEIIHKALGELSDRQRDCVVLFHSEKMTHKEIGKTLGISEGSVKQHLTRGLKNLSDALGGAK